MKFIKTPVKGMRDFLPDDMYFREYVLNLITKTYNSFGFTKIETPCIEHIENLTNKQGGDNEKLIFKILKRGEKLNEELNLNELCDYGLRYDLTVPLARYYANNMNELNSPFKSLQIGNVWRADRPQKGRFRQFTQCDIDILGDKTNMAEINLLIATSTVLKKLKLDNFKIKINDRRILKAMALYAGFKDEECDNVFISLDKADKIGFDGVKDELISNGYNVDIVDSYLKLFNNADLHIYQDLFKDYLTDDVVSNLIKIIDMVSKVIDVNIEFTPTLVRGMSYYTGTIFEIEMKDYNSSIAGGGRYDSMIEKYANIPVPACGFSIGFERLIDILKDNNFKIEDSNQKIAYLLSKDISDIELEEVLKEASNKREDGKVVTILYKNKNFNHQKEILEKDNYEIITK